MDSPSRLSLFRQGIARTLTEAGQSPFLTWRPVTRPWLRLIGTGGVAAIFVVGLISLVGGGMAFLAQSVPQLVSADLLSEVIPETPDRLYHESLYLVALAVILLLMALAILAAAAIVNQRSTHDFQWPGRRPSGQLLASGFVIMAVVGLALWPVGWLIEGKIDPAPVLNPNYLSDSRMVYALVASLMLFLAAAAEEIVFRGVLLRLLGGLTQRVWLLVVLNGVLFSLIHLDPDPAAFVARALSGMVWTWAALRLGGIEFAIGAHWANNLLIALLGQPMSEAAAVGQKIPAVYLIPELVIAVIILIATEWIVRQRPASPPQTI